MKNYFKKLYKENADQFFLKLKKNLKEEKKTFVVTANPEVFMFGTKDEEFNKLLLDKATVITPDGIGIVKAARMLNYDIKERIPGVEIAIKLLEYSNELEKKVYLYGSTQEVIDAMILVIKNNYKKIKLVGVKNGYSKDKDADFEEIVKEKPDVVLVALGIPNQEKLIYKHLNKFSKGIFVGVGGSFDVISGTKKRAPRFFIKCNLEWLYRLIKEPKRIKRFYNNNIKFIYFISKNKKGYSK